MAFLLLNSLWSSLAYDEIDHSFFLSQLEKNNVQLLEISNTEAVGTFRIPPDKPLKLNASGEPLPNKGADGQPAKLSKKFRVELDPDGSKEQIRAAEQAMSRNGQAAASSLHQFCTGAKHDAVLADRFTDHRFGHCLVYVPPNSRSDHGWRWVPVEFQSFDGQALRTQRSADDVRRCSRARRS